MRNRGRWLRVLLGLAGGFVVLWLLASWLAAYQLTRRWQPPFAEPPPAVGWATLEPQRLTTTDGLGIGAWYAAGPEQGPSVVLVHGNGASRRWCLSRAQLLASQGCSVLLISARAHGDSDGTYNDFGYGARHDVEAAVAYLERRRPGRPVLVSGTSLGAAATVLAAKDFGARVQGYLLELPYRDLTTAVRNRVEKHVPPVVNRVAFAGLMLAGRLVLPDLPRIAPVACIDAIPESVPVWILAGSQDENARPEEARDLYQRVAKHGRLIFFEGAGHDSLLDHDPELYRKTIQEWLDAVSQQGLAGEGRLP